MWPFDINKREIEAKIEYLDFRANGTNHDINEIRDLLGDIREVMTNTNREIDTLKYSLSKLEGMKAEKSSSLQELEDLKRRTESLTLWKAEIMSVLTETNPVTGQKKDSKIAKRLKAFYGK